MISLSKSSKPLIRVLVFGALVFVASSNAVHAQAGKAAQSRITIDGSAEPDRIPAWIAWRELFNMAALMADKEPDAGREFWSHRLGLSSAQANRLIAHARSLQDDEKEINLQAQRLSQGSKGRPAGALKAQLHELQADKQSRVLGMRDSLKDQIGADAILRLQSFININIAPHIKVGTVVSNGK
jgi:hypothetical protein